MDSKQKQLFKTLKGLGWSVKVIAKATINGCGYESIEHDVGDKTLEEILTNILHADKRMRGG